MFAINATLYITNDGAFFIHGQDEVFFWPDDILNTPEQIQRFIEQLPEKSHIKVVFDSNLESYETFSLPKVYPWEERKLIKRQLGRNSGKYLYKQAHKLKPPSNKTTSNSKENVYGLAMVNLSKNYVELFKTLVVKQHLITGLYSASLIYQQVLLKNKRRLGKKLKLNLERQYVLTYQLSSTTWRQLFIKDTNILLSRLVLTGDVNSPLADLGDKLAHQSFRFIKFLQSERLDDADENLPLIFCLKTPSTFDEQPFISEFNQRSINLSKTPLLVIGFEALLPHPTKDIASPMLGLHHFIQKNRIPPHYRDLASLEAQKKIFIHWGIQAITLTIGFVPLAMGYYYGVSHYYFKNATQEAQQLTQTYTHAKSQLENLLELPVDARLMENTVRLSQVMGQHEQHQLYEQDLISLSQILNDSPHVLLEDLTWESQGEVLSGERKIIFQGHVFPFRQDYQTLMSYVKAFEARLQQNPQIKSITTLELPLNPSDTTPLNITSQRLSQSAQRFKLEILLQIPKP
ncbi:MAG: hypothetical protein IE936_08595 [Moraxella osloensis]|nr:hypothetical protein [Moraxella osloensis]